MSVEEDKNPYEDLEDVAAVNLVSLVEMVMIYSY